MVKNLDPDLIRVLEDILKPLDFVTWDRLSGDNTHFSIYGWIDREQDSYKDYVEVEFWIEDKPDIWHTKHNFSTSSAKYSKKIAELLEIEGHNDCQRAEDIFKNLKTVKLNG